MNRVALVTGASSGIGRATAQVLKRNGYTVYGAGRNKTELAELIPLGIHAIRIDVTDDESMVAGVQKVIGQQGRIDVLVNDAGFGYYGTVEDVPIEKARLEIEVNLFGLARMTQLVLPHMRRQRSGKIVNIASIAGRMATPLGGWYHASKFAVEGLSDSLRQEVREFGIDTIIIQPGIISTPWWRKARENMEIVSQHTAYTELVRKGRKLLEINSKASDPSVIGELIGRVVELQRPKARYTKGYRLRTILCLRRMLSDRMFDWVIRKQLGL